MMERNQIDSEHPNHTVACIDASAAGASVCRYAAWAAGAMATPLTLLHVLDEERYPSRYDMSGTIGLGSREHLLDELVELDQQRNRLALQHGHHLLDAAERQLRDDGVIDLQKRQRHGDLAESLHDLEEHTRLFILGLHGEHSSGLDGHIGSQLETVIRTVHRPLLLVPDEFRQPRSAMVAFDGSKTGFKAIDLIGQGRLFRDTPLHLVMVGEPNDERQAQLREAQTALVGLGVDVHLAIRPGDVEKTLHDYQREHDIDVLIMGAYGHSRIRQFLVGSTTTRMLRTAERPVVILR